MSSLYWSSTSFFANNVGAWGVSFKWGNDYSLAKSSSLYARAVRGENCKSFGHSVNLIINSDETLTDTCTGLMWQQVPSSNTMTWQNAIKYSENLTTSIYNDWRLPTIKELRSIVDYSKDAPAINNFFF